MRPGNLRLIDSGSAALLRRLVAENFRPQAKRYGVAAVLMFLAAWVTGAWAWLQKDLVNEIFFKHNASMPLRLTLGIILLPRLKGFAGYGEDVVLSRISNRSVADVQRGAYKCTATCSPSGSISSPPVHPAS